MSAHPVIVDAIRSVSRTMTRELGFMGGNFAGTDLSPSAVHALIEIEPGNVSARDLADRLRLDKSSVSRLVRRLIESGEVHEEAGEEDGRVKMLSLTQAGQRRVDDIHAFGNAQVRNALALLKPGQDAKVLEGLQLYTAALGAQGGADQPASTLELVRGYRTGIIAKITDMHARYYAREYGFGQKFESVVAGGLAEFCNRLDHTRNAVWTAVRAGEIVGSVAIDGEDLGDNVAHLRWFIVGEHVRGVGVGRKLLSAALGFADEQEFSETHLWTFSGLAAARHLYESFGFVLKEEQAGAQWSKKVLEQRFVRPRP